MSASAILTAVLVGWGEADLPIAHAIPDLPPLDGSHVDEITEAVGGFGRTVALSGDRLLVGAPESGNQSGEAFVYERGSEGWSLQQTFQAVNPVGSTDWFGSSVDIDGDTLVIGARHLSVGSHAPGRAYVYQWNGSQWISQAWLSASDGTIDDDFGVDVAIEGEVLVVGSGPSPGAAYVFTRSGTQWTEQAKLIPDTGQTFSNQFGESVDISGSSIFIAAPGHDGYTYDSGATYVYTASGPGWNQQAMLEATVVGQRIPVSVGYRMAADGDFLAVGARDYYGSAGQVQVFTRVGNTWSSPVTLTPADGEDGDAFGSSVALEGNTLVVGASNHPHSQFGPGAVYLFHRRNNGQWIADGKRTIATGQAYDSLGEAVAISGNTLMAGAPGVQTVYEFERTLCQLSANTVDVSLSTGGVQKLTLQSTNNLGRLEYFVFGSASGTAPGLTVGDITLPLNLDAYFQFTAQQANGSVFRGTFGSMSGGGLGRARIQIAPGTPPFLAGLTYHHAFVVLNDGSLCASNAVPLRIRQ